MQNGETTQRIPLESLRVDMICIGRIWSISGGYDLYQGRYDLYRVDI